MTDWTGAISGAQTFADGDRITGNVTIGAGATVTVTAGATITFQGNYTITLSGSGKIVSTGTAASRIIWKSGLTDSTDSDWSYIYLGNCTSTGNSFQYSDFRNANHSGGAIILGLGVGGSVNAISNCRFIDCAQTGCSFWNAGTAGQNFTVQNCYFKNLGQGSGGGIHCTDDTVSTNTIQDCEFENCHVGIIFASTVGATTTIRRCLFKGCLYGVNLSVQATVTIDKCIFALGNNMNTSSAIYIASTVATPLITISNNIIGCGTQSFGIPIYQINATGQGITLSGNDIGRGKHATAATGVYIIDVDNGSTSNDDAIFGCATADENNFDTSNATTSTETPKQYQNLTNARTNARSTLKWPITIDTVSFSATGDGATATWNSNRPMNSEVYLAEVTGVDPDDPTTYDICFIRDDDWSTVKYGASANRGSYKDKVTGGMIGTAHSVTIAGLKAGTQYFYVVRGVDPAGNVAESTEGNFTTTGAVPAVSAVTVSPTSIKTNEETTVTATITNTPTEAAVEINDVVFDMDNTTGDTWSATIKGHLVGVVSAETVTVFATNASGGAQANSASTLTVTKPTIAAATLVHDFTVWLRDLLLNNVTDPISASRSATSKWVMSSFPQRPAEYPLVVVEVTSVSHESLGLKTEETFATINFEVRVFSKSTKQRDEIWDSIYNFLRTYQIDSGESISIDLVDFKLINATNVSEDGKGGLHQKVAELSYKIVVSS